MSELKTASSDIWNLQLGGGRKDGSVTAVIDQNFVQAEKDSTGHRGYLDSLFTFKPHSPDSICKDLGLDFGMPSGDMANMIAIQSGGPGSAVFAVDSSVDKALATNIFKDVGPGLNVTYLPTM